MIKVVPTTVEHLDTLHQLEGLFQNMDLDIIGNALVKVGVSFTMIDGGNVLGCGGVIPKWNGVGELWIAISGKLRERPLLLVKHTLIVMGMIQSRGGFHRLQLHICEDDHRLVRWAEALGFTFEGIMRQYGADKKNHRLYARIY